jgi:hypothetical protein
MRKGNINSQLIAQTSCFDCSFVVGDNHPIFHISLPIQFDENTWFKKLDTPILDLTLSTRTKAFQYCSN